MARGHRLDSATQDSTGGAPAALRLRVDRVEDLAPLAALSESVYGYLPDGSCPEYYRWLYRENPTGEAVTGNAHNGDDLVGHYGVVPMRVWLDGRELIAGLGVNSFTRRDFQGRGIFARLVTMVNEAAERRGIQMTYVLPSAQAKPWFVKFLRFTELSPLPLWVRPLRGGPLLDFFCGPARLLRAISPAVDLALAPVLRLMRTRRNPHGLELSSLRDFGPEFDALWERARKDFDFSIVRSAEHLRWRFGAVPTRTYRVWGAYAHGELVSYLVARVREVRQHVGLQTGVIADLFGTADPVAMSGARLLVAEALRWLSQRHIGLCVMQLASPGFAPALRANGFFPVARRLAEDRSLLLRSLGGRGLLFQPHRRLHVDGGDHDMG